MTAEVCVMNRLGLAIAADSAVTLGSSADKIYTSVDKMFHLALDAPVGLMIFGGASYLDLMWETIVKEFRREQGLTKLDHLEDYADQFLRFLTNQSMFPEEVQKRHVKRLVYGFFTHMLHLIQTRLDYEAEVQDGLDEGSYPAIITDETKKILANVLTSERIEGFGTATLSKIRQKYLNVF